MNDKDKEAFDKWFDKVEIKWDLEEAWQAACDYKQKKIDSIDCYIERDEKIKKLQAENEKLRELVKDLARNGMDYDIASRIEELDEE